MSPSSTVVALDAVDSTKLTLNITITRLFNEEERHLSRKLMAEYRTPTLNEPAADDDSAYATLNVTCFACRKKGHYARDCKKTGGDVKVAVARDLDTGLDEPIHMRTGVCVIRPVRRTSAPRP
jgi:hypothetical protein